MINVHNYVFILSQNRLLDEFPLEAGIKNPVDRIIPFLPGVVVINRHTRDVSPTRCGGNQPSHA